MRFSTISSPTQACRLPIAVVAFAVTKCAQNPPSKARY